MHPTNAMAKWLLALLALLALALPGVARAHPWADKDVGIGITLGEPTGLSLDLRPNDWSSFDIAVGLADFDSDYDRYVDNFYAHLEYRVRVFDLIHDSSLAVPFYLGIGGYVLDHGHNFDGGDDIGLRVPIGLAFEFGSPVQIFVELAFRYALLEIDHTEHRRLDIGGALGFRIYF